MGTRSTGVIVATLLFYSPPALAAPAIATRYSEPGRWKNFEGTQEACLSRAESTLLATGFDTIERTQQSRYGTADEYTASIRCILDMRIVLIVVSGPSRQIADRGAGALFQRFEAGE